ncbi:hypothetical protein GJ654_01740 [Rhodoblastus acidophilus]|uniref:ParG protein n=1 Tax=Rhodoblastus acidophilus TaxID=1074 RepID=A0A6N8DKE8_RHOAC|nr:hypothetical protein [Rhodoblastus acidophilus]MCW2272800.1 hypothetical protein [Rhodoblastus acidophilus]MTV29711.1 hypothetical protein [Rhodoblastus acidophilus]
MKDKKTEKKTATEPASPVTAPDQTGKSAKTSKAKSEKSTGKSDSLAKAKVEKPKDAKKALNFKVSSEFRREFKTYASAHDMKLGKLLEVAFESYRKQNGGG